MGSGRVLALGFCTPCYGGCVRSRTVYKRGLRAKPACWQGLVNATVAWSSRDSRTPCCLGVGKATTTRTARHRLLTLWRARAGLGRSRIHGPWVVWSTQECRYVFLHWGQPGQESSLGQSAALRFRVRRRLDLLVTSKRACIARPHLVRTASCPTLPVSRTEQRANKPDPSCRTGYVSTSLQVH
jgi:hypothetical protein